MAGYETTPSQTVTTVGGATTVVSGNFTQDGFLRVQLSPAIDGTISVNTPRDDAGIWQYLPAATYSVCYGVANFTPPPCAIPR